MPSDLVNVVAAGYADRHMVILCDPDTGLPYDARVGLQGAPGPPGPSFDNRAAVSAAFINVEIAFIYIAGYYTAGDGGGVYYKRVVLEPSHAGKVQSADGAWWELVNTSVVHAAMLGAKGDGITNDGPAIQSALTVAGAIGCREVALKATTYLSNEVLAGPSNVWFRGAGDDATIIRNPEGQLPGKILAGYSSNASIASIGTVGFRVSDLCIDHSTLGSTANGIQIGGGLPPCTITIASPGVVTWNNHGFAANATVSFFTTGALPTGLTVGVDYYVVGASITTNTFQVSATAGGAAINTSGSQSGTHALYGVSRTPHTTDAIVERVKVLGYDSHQYSIWSFWAKRVKIRDNVIIGNAAGSVLGSEGIEAFGGDDVEIYGNRISGIGTNSINIVEFAATHDTSINNINVHDNYIDGGGVNINVAVTTTGRGLRVVNNTCLNADSVASGQGIRIGCASGGTIGIQVLGNTIRGAKNIGIYLDFVGATLDQVVAANNMIDGMTAVNTVGINALGGPMLLQGNAIEASYIGIQHQDGSGLCAIGNKIKCAGQSMYFTAASLMFEVIGGSLRADGSLKADVGSTGSVTGVLFNYITAEVAPVTDVPSTVSVRGNTPGYAPTSKDPFGVGRNQLNNLIITRTVAQLPAASTVPVGTKEYVTDANATTGPAAGGGNNYLPVQRAVVTGVDTWMLD